MLSPGSWSSGSWLWLLALGSGSWLWLWLFGSWFWLLALTLALHSGFFLPSIKLQPYWLLTWLPSDSLGYSFASALPLWLLRCLFALASCFGFPFNKKIPTTPSATKRKKTSVSIVLWLFKPNQRCWFISPLGLFVFRLWSARIPLLALNNHCITRSGEAAT